MCTGIIPPSSTDRAVKIPPSSTDRAVKEQFGGEYRENDAYDKKLTSDFEEKYINKNGGSTNYYNDYLKQGQITMQDALKENKNPWEAKKYMDKKNIEIISANQQRYDQEKNAAANQIKAYREQRAEQEKAPRPTSAQTVDEEIPGKKRKKKNALGAMVKSKDRDSILSSLLKGDRNTLG